jgi:transcriptional regulator with XRE-family HTH domain
VLRGGVISQLKPRVQIEEPWMSPDSLPIKLRQARGAMSLTEAAEAADIPEDRIRMYEEGVRRPYGKTLRRLADVYGVRVADLLGTGQVARARSRTPEVRRRRRRITVDNVDAPIAVPLEVAEGQTVRLVIELVVRRREGDAGAAAEEDEEVEGEAVAARRVEPMAEEGPASAPAEVEREPAAAKSSGTRRRLRLPESGGRQPLDPILELKRAYRDFRQKKP